MKKMIALLAAVAVMGMGSVATADDYTLPDPQSVLSMTVTGYTTTPIGVDGASGGIYGGFGMSAYSETETGIGYYEDKSSRVEIGGDANLYINGEDQVGCGNDCPGSGFLPDNTIAMSLVGGGAAGYGLDSDGVEVVYATNANTAIVSGSENVSGYAEIASGAAASNGFWSVGAGDLYISVP